VLIGSLAIALGLGIAFATVRPAEAPASMPVVFDPRLSPAEVNALAKIDAESRWLAVVLEPDEIVTAAYFVADTARATVVAEHASDAGLDAQVIGDLDAEVRATGPRRVLLEIASLAVVSRFSLEEDHRAERPLAPPLDRPLIVPQPGLPYAGTGVPVGPLELEELGAREAVMVAALGGVVVTIDGRPYTETQVTGSCAGQACVVALYGRTHGSPSQDVWSIQGSPSNGLNARIDPADPPMLHSVPRWLVREAERISRADPAVTAELAEGDMFGEASWDPNAAGLIALRYVVACGCCGSVDDGLTGHLADHNGGPAGCGGDLTVIVDVDHAHVVGLRRG
jgi:hypothetical protein